MKRSPVAALFFGFLLCAFYPLSAAGQFRFDSWTTDNGLPQNGIRQITQTPDGYIWFTTFDGLVRFDGVKFTVFATGNSPGIVNNRFSKLVSDKHGTVWAQTEDQLLTIYRDGVFTSYDKTQIPGGVLLGFVPDADGEILLKAKDACYYLRDGQFIYDRPCPPDDGRRIVFDAPSGAKWILTPGRVEQNRNGQITLYNTPTISLLDPAASIGEITLEDSDGALWFGVQGLGACRLHNGEVTILGEKDGIARESFPRLFRQEQDGSVWFSTGDSNTKGVGIFRWADGKLTRFGPELGLSNELVMDLFRDREGTLWIATNKGLNRLRRQVITSYSVKDGLSHHEVYPIMKSREGDIVIGTAAGVSRFRDGRFTTMTWTGDQNIQALTEDTKGHLLMGITGNFIRIENGRHVRYDTGNTVAATLTRDGVIWTGSNTGLSRIENDKVTERFTTSEGLASNEVKTIVEDDDGGLWIGTYGGISHMVDGKFTNYTVNNGLPSDRVRSIYKDKEGVFWIGTYDGGLSRFKEGKFFNFTTENGLYNNGVFATVEDDHGNFWMSCNRGIYRANKKQLNDFADGKISSYESFAYGKEDGMLNTECNGGRQPSALKDSDGKIWFPTLDGVAVVDPSLIMPNQVPPPVVIENIAVDRKDTSFKEGLRVEPSQTSLDITFTAPSFIKSDQVRFKYKLDGLDDNWIDAGTRRTVNYSYVPPGEYTFTVIAANSDGVWNMEGRSVKVIVIAAFYRTWWFFSLLGVTAFLFVFLLYRYRLAQLQKVNEAKTAFTQQLIESQEAERKRIAVELHDSIGQSLVVIRNRALISLNTPEDAARLCGQMEEISDAAADSIVEVRQIAQNLHPYQLEHLGLTTAIETMIKSAAEASAIEFIYDIDELDGELAKDAEINLYRIAQEGINNILKHSGAGRVDILLKKNGNILTLSIKDNGKGFAIDHPPETGHKPGLGLTGISERAKMLDAQYEIHSIPEAGTTIILRMDLKTPDE